MPIQIGSEDHIGSIDRKQNSVFNPVVNVRSPMKMNPTNHQMQSMQNTGLGLSARNRTLESFEHTNSAGVKLPKI